MPVRKFGAVVDTERVMKYPSSFSEYVALFQDPKVYTSEIGFPAGTVKALTVAVSGYKYDVYTFDGKIMGAIPKARNADRAVTVRTEASAKYKTQYNVYAVKLGYSVQLLIMALELAQDDLGALLCAIGGVTDRCAICGAVLTDALSVSRGIGPECFSKIWVNNDDVREVMERRVKVAA